MLERPVTVVVPAFNERGNLRPVLDELVAYLPTVARGATVLVIDDGSSDGCCDDLPPGVELIRHDRNRGLTAALRTGFFAARTELVTWTPADGQIPTGELGKMFAAIGDAPLLLTTYRHRPDGLVRAVMSKTLRLMLWAAIGLRQRLEGVYLFERALLDRFPLVATRSAGSIGFEIAAKTVALGVAVRSIEIECAPRRSGTSKVANARNIVNYLDEIWEIRRSMRARR